MAQLIYIIPLFGLAALIYSLVKSRWITKQDTGTEKMITISRHIQDGAIEFLKTEYKVLIKFSITIIIALLIESLMVVFKIAIDNYEQMIHAVYLIGGVSILMVALGLFIYFVNKKS